MSDGRRLHGWIYRHTEGHVMTLDSGSWRRVAAACILACCGTQIVSADDVKKQRGGKAEHEQTIVIDEPTGSIYDGKGNRLGYVRKGLDGRYQIFDQQWRRKGELRELTPPKK